MGDHPDGFVRRVRHAPGVLVPALVGALTVVLALVIGSVSVRSGSAGDPAPLAATATPSPTVPAAGRADAMRFALDEAPRRWQPGGWRPDIDAVQELLDRRARAAEDGDVDGYVETGLVDAIARPQAESIAALPVESWSYTLGGVNSPSYQLDADTQVARETYGPDAYVLRVTLRYQLEGYDRDLVTTEHALTVAFQGGTWLVIKDVPTDGSRELWDFGGLRVVTGDRSLVVGLGPNAPGTTTLTAYANAADRGVADVTRIWGKQWQRRVLVVAAPTTGTMASALGRRSADYRQIAAVTTADHAGGTSISRGDRVFINPKPFEKLGERGRTIVLRHEIAHVATHAAVDDSMPTWMEEGFADYVGYEGSGVSTSAIVRELREWVQAGARPRSLPSDEDYDASNGDLVVSYEQSWYAAHLIATTYGRATLVELYRAMREGTSADASRGTDLAFREVLGISFDEFTREWRAAVRALA